jgi:hypothetical protein
MSSYTNISVKVSNEFANMLMEHYEAQKSQDGGIEFKGAYFGKMFEESFQAGKEKYFSQTDQLDLYKGQVEVYKRNNQMLKILSLVLFCILIIFGIFQYRKALRSEY